MGNSQFELFQQVYHLIWIVSSPAKKKFDAIGSPNIFSWANLDKLNPNLKIESAR